MAADIVRVLVKFKHIRAFFKAELRKRFRLFAFRGEVISSFDKEYVTDAHFRLFPDRYFRHFLCMTPYPAIAIDGPAASGKSTVARLVAHKLGYTFINTGAMYRAYTWYMLRLGVDLNDAVAVGKMVKSAPIEYGSRDNHSIVVFENRELDDELQGSEINDNVSKVAAIPAVREHLVAKQREYRLSGPLVMEGRDIGSVVFPDTPFKYYIDASEEVRAARRAAQGLKDSIAERDKKDSSRATAPLKVAEGARVIDSTHMSIDEVVNTVVDDIFARLK